MPVLTIYNHGTGGASSKDAAGGEIVNIFGNEAKKSGREYFDWIVTEGVGKKGGPDKQLVTNTLNVDTATGAPYPSLTRHVVTPGAVRMDDYLKSAGTPWLFRKVLGGLDRARDTALQISGIGADENVMYVLSMLRYLANNNQLPTAINMMGWSRGGVGCIRIAYFLNLDPILKNIPVNIFAIDPVAGEGHDNEPEAHTIGDNVKNYVATLAVHENRKGFTPMTLTSDPSASLRFTGTTKYAILHMPGIHADTAKFISSSGKLTFHLCYQFLTQHGTVISNELRGMFKMTSDTQLSEYDKLLQGAKVSDIKTGQKGAVARFITGRERREVHNATNGNSQFFVNAHHLVLFKRKYPVLWNKYFTPVASGKGTLQWQQLNNAAWGRELGSLGPGHLAGIGEQDRLPGAPQLPTHLRAGSQQCVELNQLAF